MDFADIKGIEVRRDSSILVGLDGGSINGEWAADEIKLLHEFHVSYCKGYFVGFICMNH